MPEILVHSYDDEPCDLGLDRYEDNICQHGNRAHWVWVETKAA